MNYATFDPNEITITRPVTPAQLFVTLDAAVEELETAVDILDTLAQAKPSTIAGPQLQSWLDRLAALQDELLTAACNSPRPI